ncbi:hypothetical protein C8J56DRAFT_967767 [Mycena floridula]|nr:hypothetical protein C8J56DRAFT_967767 [Mycena floridula]
MLPPELFEVIVDHVQDNPTLFAFSLVSRNTLPRARYHLFRVLSVNLSAQRLVKLFSILQSSMSTRTLAPFVQVLSVGHMSHCRLEKVSDVERAIQLLPQILACLPSTTSFTIRKTDFEAVPDWTIQAFFQIFFNNITSITLASLHFLRFTDFAKLISSMISQVGNRKGLVIEVQRVGWTYGRLICIDELPVIDYRNPTRINLGWVRKGDHLQDIVDWLETCPSLFLSSIQLTTSTAVQAASISRCLARYRSRILDLVLWSPVWTTAIECGEIFQTFLAARHEQPIVSHFPKLQSLTVKQLLLRPGDPMSRAVNIGIPQLFNMFVGKGTRAIRLEFLVTAPHSTIDPVDHARQTLAEFDWEALKKLLSIGSFRKTSTEKSTLQIFIHPNPNTFDTATATQYMLTQLGGTPYHGKTGRPALDKGCFGVDLNEWELSILYPNL